MPAKKDLLQRELREEWRKYRERTGRSKESDLFGFFVELECGPRADIVKRIRSLTPGDPWQTIHVWLMKHTDG